MNYILSYSIVLLTLISPSALDEGRKTFAEINSIEQAEEFIISLQNDSSPEAMGYVASMNFMKSHFLKFPFTKLKYFKRGKKSLDNLINKNPKNVEIRYIRFLMQKQIPKFLGYNKHIDEDFKIITNGIEENTVSYEVKSIILTNMLNVENLSLSEKEKINLLLDQL